MTHVNVNNIDNLELDKIVLKTTYIQDSDTMNLEFDVLVVGELIFQEITRHNDFDDDCEAWFRVTCSAFLDANSRTLKYWKLTFMTKTRGEGTEVAWGVQESFS